MTNKINYTKEEIIRGGYVESIPVNGTITFPLETKTWINYNKGKNSRYKERYVLEDIAIRKKGENSYLLADFVYQNVKKGKSEVQYVAVEYKDGKKEVIVPSAIEELLSKDYANKSLSEVWKSLNELNNTF